MEYGVVFFGADTDFSVTDIGYMGSGIAFHLTDTIFRALWKKNVENYCKGGRLVLYLG